MRACVRQVITRKYAHTKHEHCAVVRPGPRKQTNCTEMCNNAPIPRVYDATHGPMLFLLVEGGEIAVTVFMRETGKHDLNGSEELQVSTSKSYERLFYTKCMRPACCRSYMETTAGASARAHQLSSTRNSTHARMSTTGTVCLPLQVHAGLVCSMQT